MLTGLQSDDQGFGQVGVILAEKLGMPHATIIMEVQATPGEGQAGSLKVKRELEGGWFQWLTLPLPALLTIQSGINQLRYATLKGIMAAKKKEIRKVSPAGDAAAGQKILQRVFPREGQADADARGLAGRGREGARAEAARRSEGDLMILVIAEQRDGALNRASWEAIAAAQAGRRPGDDRGPGRERRGRSRASWPRPRPRGSFASSRRRSRDYTADGYVLALSSLIEQEKPERVFFAHTYQTRDFAPALAARLERSLVTDVTGIKAGDGRATYVRPVFQGKLSADVTAEGPAPHLVTIQIGAYRADAVKKGASAAAVRTAEVTVDAGAIRQKPEAPFKEAKQAVDLSQAERIVAIGRGIKGEEHLKLAQDLAKALGAEIAASRPICDAGWLPMDRQIGSSGQTVAPKLYVALGISGAIQHLVGMKGSRTIVAINKDPEAPIFEIADFGITGDLFEVVPAMIAELKG